LKTREGDFIESLEGLIFDVKGLVHPPEKIIAFVRYFPEEIGGRIRDGLTYGKVYSLSDRDSLLKKDYPQYLVYDPVFDETMCEVPLDRLKKRYDPIEKLLELEKSEITGVLEKKALKLVSLLSRKARTPEKSIGISGSLLVGLHRANSDIDLIVYGSSNCRKVDVALREMLNDRDFALAPYGPTDLRTLFDFRSKDTAIRFEDFVRTESRKAFQGRFMNTDYFIRFVKDWNEIDQKYGDLQYKNLGHAKIKADISDDSESLFTPCTYSVENVAVVERSKDLAITEICSFRGRFCEQARNSETVIARGKVEKVTDTRTGNTHLRLLIGNDPSDHMILA
jgi:predicted nucleotidyltransferase